MKKKQKKYIVKRGFFNLMIGMIGLSGSLGFVVGRNLPEFKTPEEVASEIRICIEDAMEKEEDIEIIKKEAYELAKQSGMIVGFGMDDKIRIMIDLGDRNHTLEIFDIDKKFKKRN